MYIMFQPLKKYATFSGRACRKEFWLFVLFINATLFALIISAAIFYAINPLFDQAYFIDNHWINLFTNPYFGPPVIFACAMLVPQFAVTVRRLHDTDRRGWWCLLGLPPYVGLILLVLLVLPGTIGDNRFGPDPLAAPPPKTA
jgi:uncharacterized membrane protein YhaH (DUF805 family)